MNIPKHLEKVRSVDLTPQNLIDFELRIKEIYEKGDIKAPIHLSKGNETQLIEIFQYIHPEDWIFSSWRNHYHALLHGYPQDKLFDWIASGGSMSTNSSEHNFYSSAIVGGILPIALGAAQALKIKKSERKVWCFIGDMTFETGIFYEVHKYAINFNLPLQFVVEDNNMSTNTPTDLTWNGIKRPIPEDVIYYSYERGFPHHGTGGWVLF
jgi:pyruvate dehydrogenase E1 component alpha subunit